MLALLASLALIAQADKPPAYSPIFALGTREDGMRLELPVSLSARFEDTSSYPLDSADTRLGKDAALDPQIRAGIWFDSRRDLLPILLFAELEADFLTGPVSGQPTLDAPGLPDASDARQVLRKAWGRASLGPYLHAGGGVAMSHWGLGLVANDGAHGWTPGSARFDDPRRGDRVLRGLVATGPLSDLAVAASLAVDDVLEDDAELEGDRARQLAGAFIIGRNKPNSAGAYVVRRVQDAADGARTEVTVVDVTGKLTFELASVGKLQIEAEAAWITGETGFASTPDFPVQDVDQLGATLSAVLDAGLAGGALDVLYASGDGDLDDGEQNAFRPDPNFPMGLILFRHLLAAKTGRAAVRAADPGLIGVPPAGLVRYPTRGSATGTLSFFPRLFVRPAEGLEVYGGPLFAFSTAPIAAPLETRLQGGTPVNDFGGSPGDYLGTEIDAGLRYRKILGGTEITAGIEGGLFFPGSAFEGGGDGARLETIRGGRALVALRL